MYKPLPKGLTIQKSPIEGLGLFATENINKNSFIGVTHIRDEQFENKYIRTPLGGFYNHSNEPNVIRIPPHPPHTMGDPHGGTPVPRGLMVGVRGARAGY